MKLLTRYGLAAITAGLFFLGIPDTSHARNCDSSGPPDFQTFEGAYNGEVTLCQNWTEEEQQAFWFTGQGSMIIPYTWFLALETERSEVNALKKLSSPEQLNTYRYLPQKPTRWNPDGLPIGFTRDTAKGNRTTEKVAKNWLGFTCAACHTGQIEFGGAKALIDGAPALANFEAFFIDLAASMQATLEDDAKFQRFASNVVKRNMVEKEGAQAADELREQLSRLTRVRQAWNKRNSGTHPYGHARLDAIGAIFNEIEWAARKDISALPSGKANAPVSYPFIWDTPQHDKVQWNGSVANAGLGAISRNIGEVLGVFGGLDLNTTRLSRLGHRNSIQISHLGQLEQLLWDLQSPRWQDMEKLVFASDLSADEKERWRIDNELAGKGEDIFTGRKPGTASFACASCHRPIQRDDPDRRIKATMIRLDEIGTDPTMAVNFQRRHTEKHDLQGLFKNYWGFLSDYKRFDQKAADVEMLKYSVIGVLTREMFERPVSTIRALKVGQPEDVKKSLEKVERSYIRKGIDRINLFERKDDVESFLRKAGKKLDRSSRQTASYCHPVFDPCYKARSLNGIWATAPYLHNGSVRTIRQLLQPSKREVAFHVGSRRYDPDDLGFIDDGTFGTVLATSLPGNANTGHSFYRDYFEKNPADLEALLEYLKTL